MKTEIIYEDRDLLVIRKPAGLATQTARIGQPDVVSELKNYLAASGAPKPPYLGIIHRLDQPVEGLLVFAKNKKAAGEITRQLGGQEAERLINKHYYAVVCGKPSLKEGTLVDNMYKDTQTGKAMILEGGAGGTTPKRAVLHYNILQTVKTPSDEEITLADIQIDTGRFHQIRAQMAHAGMALLGDEKYGGETVTLLSRKMGIRSVALCAVSLSFVHPVTGEQLHFQTKPHSEGFAFFSCCLPH